MSQERGAAHDEAKGPGRGQTVEAQEAMLRILGFNLSHCRISSREDGDQLCVAWRME